MNKASNKEQEDRDWDGDCFRLNHEKIGTLQGSLKVCHETGCVEPLAMERVEALGMWTNGLWIPLSQVKLKRCRQKYTNTCVEQVADSAKAGAR